MSTLMLTGFKLMAIGMGAVFIFLATLVLGVTLMSAIVTRLAGPIQQATQHPVGQAPAGAQPEQNEELIAVVGAAVSKFRTK